MYFEITLAGRERLALIRQRFNTKTVPSLMHGELALLLLLLTEPKKILSESYFQLLFTPKKANEVIATCIERGYIRALNDRELVLYRLQGKI